jgi:hypothetical protein
VYKRPPSALCDPSASLLLLQLDKITTLNIPNNCETFNITVISQSQDTIMADNLRSKVDMTPAAQEAQVLGAKATGGIDNDADHVPNVEGGLKAYV